MPPQKLYALDCAGGRKYIGLTRDLDARWAAHASGRGAMWTKVHPPLCISLARDVPEHSAKLEEQRLTAQLMLQHGVNNVRGANLSSSYCYDESDKPLLAATVKKALGLDYAQATALVENLFRKEKEERSRHMPAFQCADFADVEALTEITGRMRLGEGSYSGDGLYREPHVLDREDAGSIGGGTQDGECGEPDFLTDERFSRDGDFPEDGDISDDIIYSSEEARAPYDARYHNLLHEEGSTSGDSFPEGSDVGEDSLHGDQILEDTIFPGGGDSPDDDGFPVGLGGSADSASSDDEEGDCRRPHALPEYERYAVRNSYEAHEQVFEHTHTYVHENHCGDDVGDGDNNDSIPDLDIAEKVCGDGDSEDDRNSGIYSGGGALSEDEGYASDKSSGGGEDPNGRFSDQEQYSEDVTYSDDGF